MSSTGTAKNNFAWLGVVAVLFGVLLLASHSTELLKQIVLSPGSSADMNIAAQCREDELEEEQLSLQECQLMVSNVQIVLASSPEWFRSFQISLSSIGIAAALFSLVAAYSLASTVGGKGSMALLSFGMLLLLDVAGFIAAVNTGPLLRAQYLWPLLLWFFIHLCMLIAVIIAKNNTNAAEV